MEAPPPHFTPPPQAPDEPPQETKGTEEEPWGDEDPLLWSAQRARRHALWGSFTIAFLILLFEGGLYALFTTALYEGSVEGKGGLILLLLTPFFLAVVAAVATGALARNVGRMSRQPGAPEGARPARAVLWFSTLLWALLFIVFPASLRVQTEPNPGEDPFPIGILTVLPLYMGFCVAIYTTGAALATWSERRKLEQGLVMLLGWAALGMFLILPAVISTWNLGSESPEVDWDSAIWWLRFGHFFATLVPWLIVVGLHYVYGRVIYRIELELEETGAPPMPASPGAGCPRCGGSLMVHPRTQEVFCTACGAGLSDEAASEVEGSPLDIFVEQAQPPAPTTVPAPTHASAPPVEAPPAQPSSAAPGVCQFCGGELGVLSATQQIYCTACGAGLPKGQRTAPPTGAPPPAPAPSAAPVPVVPPTASPPPGGPQVATPPVQPPASGPPAQHATTPPPSSGRCTNCGSALTIHPRTQDVFCPACGAGLRPEPEPPW